jgi:hypothetical protein
MWNRIGYIEGKIQYTEKELLISRSILLTREPFLWFKTRKVIEIGDNKTIILLGINSPHHREYKLKVNDWLLGGTIEYTSDTKFTGPNKILKLVKND